MTGVKVDNLIARAADNGWDFFKDVLDPQSDQRPSQLSPEALARQQKLAHVWASFYASDDGRQAIDALVDITLGRVTFTAVLGLPMDAAYGAGCQREGQNAIVFMLLKMIAEGRKEQQPTERTAT